MKAIDLMAQLSSFSEHSDVLINAGSELVGIVDLVEISVNGDELAVVVDVDGSTMPVMDELVPEGDMHGSVVCTSAQTVHISNARPGAMLGVTWRLGGSAGYYGTNGEIIEEDVTEFDSEKHRIILVGYLRGGLPPMHASGHGVEIVITGEPAMNFCPEHEYVVTIRGSADNDIKPGQVATNG